MAKLPRLPAKLRRALEIEGIAAQLDLDDDVVEYLAGMLEAEEVNEEEVAETWCPFIFPNVAAGEDSVAREACSALLRRVRSFSSSGSASPALSRTGSASPVLNGLLPRAPSTCTPIAPPGKVRGLDEWLERLKLSHYAASACDWCAGMGAVTVSEVIENWEEFCNELKLKPLERKRVEKQCCGHEPDTGEAEKATGLSRAEAALPPAAHANGDGGAPLPFGPAVAPAAAQRRPRGRRRSAQEPGEAHCGASGAVSSRARVVDETFGPPERQYKILYELGSGATATVYKCMRDGQVYAAKAIDLTKLRMKRDFPDALERLHRETMILFSLRHPNVVSLYDVVEAREKLYLVMEYVEGGDLFNDIARNGAFSEAEARYVFLQMVLGLRYIHSKRVVHRDLKLDNVLIDRRASRPSLLEVKISDFGHSKLINEGDDAAVTRVGTPQYWAPEVADARTCARGYDERVDLWSLGVVLYTMVEGKYPFHGQSRTGVQFPTDSDLSPAARHLIKSLVQVAPDDRLPLDDCLRHPWVMVASGPLARIVTFSDGAECLGVGDLEHRVKLPRTPWNVKRLRRELQQLTFRFKFPVMLRQREVAVCFLDALPETVQVAWSELMKTLERHFPDGSFKPPDLCSLDSYAPLPLWTAPARERCVSASEVSEAPGVASISVVSGEEHPDAGGNAAEVIEEMTSGVCVEPTVPTPSPAQPPCSGSVSGAPERQRVALVFHKYDDKIDARPHKQGLVKRSPSFFLHLKETYPDVSGFLSYGEPGVIFVQGPRSEVRKIVADVTRFKSLRDVEEKPLDESSAHDNEVSWRLFNGFLKKNTDDLRGILEEAGCTGLYDELMAMRPSRARPR